MEYPDLIQNPKTKYVLGVIDDCTCIKECQSLAQAEYEWNKLGDNNIGIYDRTTWKQRCDKMIDRICQ